MTKPTLTQILTCLGSLLLLTIAVFHMTGLVMMRDGIAVMEPGFIKNALPGLWITPSVHWVFIACLAFGLSFYTRNTTSIMLIAFGLMMFVDAAIIYAHVGFFIAEVMLAGAGLLFLISGWMMRREMKRATEYRA